MTAGYRRVEFRDIRAETAELLPPRDALSLFNVANIISVNLSLALNAGTLGGTALSDAGLLIGSAQH